MRILNRMFLGCRSNAGLSLIETVVGAALFAFIAMTLYNTYQRVFTVARAAQERVDAIAVGTAQIEIARNLSYGNVGTIAGIPSGVLPQVQTITSGGKTFIATTTVRNIDFPFDGTAGGAPDDLSPADNKLVEIELACTSCKNFRPLVFTTNIAPLNLEGNSANGSLFIRTIDSAGGLIGGADVKVVNNAVVPPINILDITATSGMLQLIDAPPGNQSYEITVSKAGYSTEQTRGLPTTTNPVIPHATVVAQAVTQLTFSIDRNATLNFSSVTPSCAVVSNANFELTGSKLISTLPNVPKYDKFFTTGGAGQKTLNDIEWDSYALVATSATHDLAGVAPFFPLSVVAGATQNVQLIMVPKSGKAVMVTVKDVGTGGPITGATVTMDDGVNPPIVETTGRGYLRQTDWSGGSGQEDYVDETRYATNDGNVDPIATPGVVQLSNTLGVFATNGYLESSTFDTGSPANFYQFTYQPGAQPSDPMLGDSQAGFQIATGNSTSSWTYLGPDGTAGTFYNSTTTNINAANNGKRYLRYKMYLTTASTTLTPSVSDIQFNFTSACVPPGQVLFQNLPNGNYTLTVSAPGYVADVSNVTVDASTLWQEAVVTLSP